MSVSASPRRVFPPVVLLPLLFLCATPSSADEPVVTAIPVTSTIAAEPRATATFAVAVRNAGDTPRVLSMTVLPPADMRTLAVGGDFMVEGGETVVRIASVAVPSNLLAGIYPVTCRIVDRDDPAIAAQCEVLLEVMPKASLELQIMESPGSVIAGQPYTISFFVRNSGNVNARFDLAIRSSIDLPLEVRGIDRLEARELVPGVQEIVVIAVKTDRTIPTSILHHLRVVARFRMGQTGIQAGGSDVAGTATSTVEIVPVSVGGSGLMHTIGGRLETTATATVSDVAWGAIVESFTAAGSIDEAGEHQIDLLVRLGLASDQTALLAPPDTFTLGYRHDLGELHLGELTYTISPLLAKDQLGFGSIGILELAPFEVGALYSHDIWAPTGSSVLAGYIRRQIPRGPSRADMLYDVRLSALGDLSDHATFGLWQQLFPIPSLAIQLDTALEVEAGPAFVPAILASISGSQGLIDYRTQFVRSWAGFEGLYSDLLTFSANATVGPLFGNLSLTAGFWFTDANPDLNPFLPSADRMLKATLSANGTVTPWGTRLSGGWELERNDDRLLSAYHTRKNTISFSARQKLGPVALAERSALKFLVDDVSGSTSFEQNHALDVSWELLEAGTELSASLKYDGVFGDNASTPQSLDISLGVQDTSEWTEWSFGMSSQQLFGDAHLLRLSAGIKGTYQYTFAQGHTLAAQGSLGITTDRLTWNPSFSLGVTYGVPLDIPVSRKKGTAVVHGTVFREDTGAKLPGVLLRLDGLAAVTDEKGAFTFNVQHAGTYSLRVEGGRAAAGLIAAYPDALRLDLAPDSERTVDVAMTRGATVKGTASLYRPPTDAGLRPSTDSSSESGGAATSLVKAQGLGGVLIEIESGTTRRRRLTNGNGDFLFEQMVPGTYTLRVVDALLPSYTRFEKDSFQLVLAPGDVYAVELRVVPEQRQVKILPGETTLVLTGRPGVKPGAIIGTGTTTTTTTQSTTTTRTTDTTTTTTQATDSTATTTTADTATAGTATTTQAADTTATTTTTDATTKTTTTAVEPAIPPAPGERRVAPDTPSREALVMAAQAAFDAPRPTWEDIVAIWRPALPEPSEPPMVTAVAATTAPTPTTPTTTTAAAAATATQTATGTTPATTKPPTTTPPAATPPTTAPATATPTTPVVGVAIPIPMPTPRPPIIVPAPSPTPRPFVP